MKCPVFIHAVFLTYPWMWKAIHWGSCWWVAWRCKSYRPWRVCLPCSCWTCTDVSSAVIRLLLLLLLLLQLSSEQVHIVKCIPLNNMLSVKQSFGWWLFKSQRLESQRGHQCQLKTGSIAPSGKNTCLHGYLLEKFCQVPPEFTDNIIPTPYEGGCWEISRTN